LRDHRTIASTRPGLYFHCKEQSRNNGRSFLQPAVCIALLASTGTVAGAGRHRFRLSESGISSLLIFCCRAKIRLARPGLACAQQKTRRGLPPGRLA
jgi:hypothetical protein